MDHFPKIRNENKKHVKLPPIAIFFAFRSCQQEPLSCARWNFTPCPMDSPSESSWSCQWGHVTIVSIKGNTQVKLNVYRWHMVANMILLMCYASFYSILPKLRTIKSTRKKKRSLTIESRKLHFIEWTKFASSQVVYLKKDNHPNLHQPSHQPPPPPFPFSSRGDLCSRIETIWLIPKEVNRSSLPTGRNSPLGPWETSIPWDAAKPKGWFKKRCKFWGKVKFSVAKKIYSQYKLLGCFLKWWWISWYDP